MFTGLLRVRVLLTDWFFPAQERIHLGDQIAGEGRIILLGGGARSLVGPALTLRARVVAFVRVSTVRRLLPTWSFVPVGSSWSGTFRSWRLRWPLCMLLLWPFSSTRVHHRGSAGHGEGMLLHHRHVALDQALDIPQVLHFLLVA